MTLIVICPKCKHQQKTNPQKIVSAVKTCVYCGKRFKIHSNEKKTQILKRV
ncbi:MAG: hypothetical protein KKF46_07005 [Nanoarchaeota archaeon]|nr:hypothetical protein [Nanoarchaeota archaeon]MBU1322077.1 hypothetical protein [Nanoarchaeota archaeon]MBU1598183.1 hypothetical protein [Nanoarchaeota archaeon]MBU2441313.1 hypothetical protein [Nanoarchaeota archaeon]